MGGVSSEWRGCKPDRTNKQIEMMVVRANLLTHTERKCTTSSQWKGSRFLHLAKDRQSGGR